jgi:hypothetical protein
MPPLFIQTRQDIAPDNDDDHDEYSEETKPAYIGCRTIA